MNAKVALSILCLLGSAPAAFAEDDKRAFKLSGCDTAGEASMVAFRNGEGQGRYIWFMDAYREFKIGVPDNKEFRKENLKGVLKWDSAISIRILPTAVPGLTGHMQLQYRHKERNKVIELGLIDELCLTALKKRYAAYLRFEPA